MQLWTRLALHVIAVPLLACRPTATEVPGAQPRSATPDTPTAATTRELELNVAIFAHLPDAANAIERLEASFEREYLRAHGTKFDLDLELWDPYATTPDPFERMHEFDLVEIDLLRFEEVLSSGKAEWAIDVLPDDLRVATHELADPHVADAHPKLLEYSVPHWLCGNFLIGFSSNTALGGAKNYEELVRVLNPKKGKPLFADLYGSNTLGSFYLDALADLKGAGPAVASVTALAAATEDAVLDPAARDQIFGLAEEMLPEHRSNLDHFHDFAHIYPRAFASNQGGALIGYSERLYYLQLERQLADRKPRTFEKSEITVRPVPFGKGSQATPMWIDAFVVPAGKTKTKRVEIRAFLDFVTSEAGYHAFAEPNEYLPASHLMPALRAGYSDALAAAQPAIRDFLPHLGEAIWIVEPRLVAGIQAAGRVLKAALKPAADGNR